MICQSLRGLDKRGGESNQVRREGARDHLEGVVWVGGSMAAGSEGDVVNGDDCLCLRINLRSRRSCSSGGDSW